MVGWRKTPSWCIKLVGIINCKLLDLRFHEHRKPILYYSTECSCYSICRELLELRYVKMSKLFFFYFFCLFVSCRQHYSARH